MNLTSARSSLLALALASASSAFAPTAPIAEGPSRLGSSFSVDELSAAVITARGDGDWGSSLGLIDAAAASASQRDRLLLALWRSRDLYELSGPDAAVEALAPLLAAEGKVFERSWPHVGLATAADYLAHAGRVTEAADMLIQVVTGYPDEADVPTLLEQVESMRYFGRADATGPHGLLEAELAGFQGALGVDLSRGASVGTRALADVPSRFSPRLAPRVAVGPVGGAVFTTDSDAAARLLEPLLGGMMKPARESRPGSTATTGVTVTASDGRSFELLLGEERGALAYVGIVSWPTPRPEESQRILYNDADSGFQQQLPGGYCSGYWFNGWSAMSGCFHPGIDEAKSGCNDPLYAEGNGLVRDTGISDWGSYVIEHRWAGTTSFSQGGHCQTVLVSPYMTVTKGQKIATVGQRPPASGCHLHAEHRETDHPAPTSRSYWNPTEFQKPHRIEAWYDSDWQFVTGHPSYASSALTEIDDMSCESPFAGGFTLKLESYCTNPDYNYAVASGSSATSWMEAVIRAVPRTRRYYVYAWINGNATSRSVPYYLVRNGVVMYSRRVDQYATRGTWQYIGYLDSNAGDRLALRVTSATGETAGQKVVVERVQFR